MYRVCSSSLYYTERPRNAAGHGMGKILMTFCRIVLANEMDCIQPSPLCFAMQNIGEIQRSESDEERG